MKVDWSTDERKLPKPGIYEFEVESAETKTGQNSGIPYISVRMRAVDDASVVVFDTLSFSPNAKNILQAKLSAIGLEGIEEIEPEDFIGRRIVAATKLEPDMKGVQRLVIDIGYKGTKAGYFQDDQPVKPTSEQLAKSSKKTPEGKPDAFDDFDADVAF